MDATDGIACPDCGGPTDVRRTTNQAGYITRRRFCTVEGCSGRLTTAERPVGAGATNTGVKGLSTGQLDQIREMVRELSSILGDAAVESPARID